METPPTRLFIDLSVLLEQQMNEVQGLKTLILAMHATLEHLDPKYKEKVLKELEAQPKGTRSPEAAALANARRILLELRNYR